MGDRVVAERYAVGSLLGRGGMGEVYEATDTRTGREVALKIMRLRDAEPDCDAGTEDTEREWEVRFEREVRAIIGLQSPHVVELLDHGVDAETNDRFIVMERLRGEDLATLHRRLGPLPVQLVLRIAAQTLLGLEKAHASGVVHRDIKPGNLFLTTNAERPDERSIRVLDFGIARIGSGSGAELTELTRTGSMLGSPQYMSPEQAKGAKSVDQRADLWSLGVVMYRLLSGTIPHSIDDGVGGLLVAICTLPPPPLQDRAPWVPAEVAAIVHGALRLKREDRFPSARAMLDALLPLLPEGNTTIDASMIVELTTAERSVIAPRRPATKPPPAPINEADTVAAVSTTQLMPNAPRVRARRQRMTLLAIGIGTVVAAGTGAAGFALRPRPEPVVAKPAEPPPPPAEIHASLTVPAGAKVEIDGAPAPVDGTTVALHGAAGTSRIVKVTVGETTKTAPVLITANGGAFPPSIDIEPAPSAAKSAPRPTTRAPTARGTAAPKPAAPAPAETGGIRTRFE